MVIPSIYGAREEVGMMYGVREARGLCETWKPREIPWNYVPKQWVVTEHD